MIINSNEKVLFYKNQKVIEVLNGKKRYYSDRNGNIYNHIVDRNSLNQNQFIDWNPKKKKLPNTRIKKLKTILENKNENQIDSDDFI